MQDAQKTDNNIKGIDGYNITFGYSFQGEIWVIYIVQRLWNAVYNIYNICSIFFSLNSARLRAQSINVDSVENPAQEDDDDEDEDDDDNIEELQDLVNLFLDEQEDEKSNKFLVFLRIAPSPESLVKGYDFKMLNK